MTITVTENESPIRKALNESAMGQTQSRKPLDPANVPIKVMFWRVLVEPVPPKSKHGLLELPDIVQDAQRILTTVGRVVQIGHFAFKSRTAAGLNLAEEPNKPEVGDYVLYEQYAGQEIHLRTGHILRVLNDTEILCLAKDHEEIKGYL